MRYVFSCLAAAGALCLTACAGPGAPALPLTPPASLSGPLAQGQAAWPQGAWWRAFADPQLDALIERALADAPSMQLARARLRQAVAVGEQAGAALLPGAALNADVTRQRYSEHGMVPPPMAGSWRTSGQLSLDFAYDLDLAGGERARRDAAQDRAQAAGADEAGARLLLSAALTHAYWGAGAAARAGQSGWRKPGQRRARRRAAGPTPARRPGPCWRAGRRAKPGRRRPARGAGAGRANHPATPRPCRPGRPGPGLGEHPAPPAAARTGWR